MKKSSITKILISIAILCLFQYFATAQKNDSIIFIDGITVESESLLKDKAIYKIKADSSTLSLQQSKSLSEILINHTPIFVKSYGQNSLSTVSFRGTAASHTRVEWNGMNINNPMLGQVDFSQIPVWFIDDFEVLPGGNSSHTGVGAIGGSVNIQSLPSFGTPIYGAIALGAGSFENYQSLVKIGGGFKNIQFRFRAIYEQSENNFEFYNTANGLWNYQKQKNASYNKYGTLSEVFYRTKNHLITTSLWQLHSFRNLPAIMSYEGSGRRETQNDDDLRWSLQWQRFSEKYYSSLSLGHSHNKTSYFLSSQTIIGPFVNHNTQSTTNTSFLKYKSEWTPKKKIVLKTLAIANFDNADYWDIKEESKFDAQRLQLLGGVSMFYEWSRKFSSFALLNLDYANDGEIAFVPTIGFEIAPFKTDDLKLKSNLSKVHHRPTLNDMYWQPGGNPHLKSENGYSIDWGFHFTKQLGKYNKLDAKLVLYASLIDDWIIWQPSDFRYWRPTNLQKVFARGAERFISLNTILGKFTIDTKISYSMNFTSAKEANGNLFTDYKNQLLYIPKHVANANISIVYKNSFFNYGFNYTSARYTVQEAENSRHKLPQYKLHSLTLGQSLEVGKQIFEAKFSIENLLDTDYQAILWRAMPGRHYQFFIKMTF